MTGMGDWRDKDDLDLTADDLGTMLVVGEAVELVGVGGHGVISVSAPAFAAVNRVAFTFGGGSKRVNAGSVGAKVASRGGQGKRDWCWLRHRWATT